MSNKKSVYDIAKKLEEADENKWYLVWIRCGAFFVAIESSAIILSEELNLKRTCLKPGVCKVGFPVASLFDYVKKLENIGISFVIYNYSKDEMIENGERYAESYRFEGGYMNKSKIKQSCENCPYYKKAYNNIDIFEELKRLQELKNQEKTK